MDAEPVQVNASAEVGETVDSAFIPPPNAVDISPEHDGGVWKEIKREGSGDDTPMGGDKVVVHYVGSLLDGSKFDSSRDRDEKFEFTLGEGQVIKAWDIGVATMRRGEVAVLTCKPQYGYGEAGSAPKIPPNAVLVFEVELFDWHGEDLTEAKDLGVIKNILKAGTGWATPKEGASTTVHITGFCNGRQFEDRQVTLTLGEGHEVRVVEGVELAIGKMKAEERARVKVAAQYAYGDKGNEELGIPPHNDLVYNIQMISFEKVKESWEMDDSEKLEQANIKKEKGTKQFKENQFKQAKVSYQKMIDYLQYEDSMDGDSKVKRDTLLLAAYSNLAMCALKMNDNAEAVKNCDKVLELDPANEKALFRRGLVNMNLKNYEEALKDFEQVLQLSENKAAKHQVIIAHQKIKEYRDQQKKMFGNIFDRMAKAEEKELKQQRIEVVDPPSHEAVTPDDQADTVNPTA